MCSLNAAGDRVLVQPDDAEQKIGSIIIPDSAQPKPVRGTIINVGEEIDKIFHPGQQIVFSKYGGVEIEWEGNDYLFLRQSDILGTVSPDE